MADGLVVVGVHSAKFENERRDASIADAVRRYHIHHPVVNDAKLALWQALNIRSWPSLAVLGPLRDVGRPPPLPTRTHRPWTGGDSNRRTRG